MKGQRVVFPEPKKVELESFEVPAVGAGQVRVRAICTQISTGTETIVYNHTYEKGTGFDGWVKHPFYPGYSFVGEVEEVGAGVGHLKRGDRVVMRKGHASHVVCDAGECACAPQELDPRSAVWFALAKIASMGARAAKYELGDNVLVVGAGPIGQMTVRWAAAAGVETLVVVDPVASRLELAKRGGATATLASGLVEASESIARLSGGRKPNVVVDTTGYAPLLPDSIRQVRRLGRMVLLGHSGQPSKSYIADELTMNGITLVGAHDGHEDAEWNAAKIYRLFFSLVRAGRFDLEGLNSHCFVPSQCREAYELLCTRRAETMGVLFDWTKV